jgi:glutamate N-acetyltransferase / amino-acid N-acetyltransferase
MKNWMKKISAGITFPQGYLQSGIHCGIKKRKPDLALIFSEEPARACGVFTKNSFLAAPVIVAKEYLAKTTHRAVFVNSGNANCLTGKQGIKDAKQIAKQLAVLLGCEKEQVLVCSTGIIGKRLPMDKIGKGLNLVASSLRKADSGKAARAIMTTDTCIKQAAYRVRTDKGEFRLSGMAKGAGMISPDMATMIAVITTDAGIGKSLLQKALQQAVDRSFNTITVDGDMSTNDAVLVLANGCSGVRINKTGQAYTRFQAALDALCLDLAKMIVKDAEGATKFIQIDIKNAKNKAQAKEIGLSIANSPLFKTMCYGENPNFGRVAAALGAVKSHVDSSRIDIYLNKRLSVSAGTAVAKTLPKSIFRKKEISVIVDIKTGRSDARIYTSDLSPEYVKINAAYS